MADNMGVDDQQYDKKPVIPLIERTVNFMWGLIDGPITWFREKIVEPNRTEYYWYHERMRRVPTIDECYEDDMVCQYEANEQHLRDLKVDSYIEYILYKRFENCKTENPEYPERCEHLHLKYTKAIENNFIKYGDLGIHQSAYYCYMKQKHRMAWERRHGPVGSGRKKEKIVIPEKSTC